MLADPEGALRIIKRLGVEQSANILTAFYYGGGVRSFHRGYQSSFPTIFRHISILTNFIHTQMEKNFVRGGMGGTKLRLSFGREWEGDGKVIPVSPTFRGEVYQWIRKKGRYVAKLLIMNVLDRETHFCLLSEAVGRGGVPAYVDAFVKARQRAGFSPARIFFDGAQSEPISAARVFGKHTQVVVLAKTGEKSQLHLAEGYHKLMDRKLESGIHAKDDLWLLRGIWLHYNFVESKHQLGGLTPFQKASHQLVDWNGEGWGWLLKYSIETYRKENMETPARATCLSAIPS